MMTIQKIRTLIFDIGGTVFDWSSAITETLDRVVPRSLAVDFDRTAFSRNCRAKFLELNSAVMSGAVLWHSSDQMLSRVVREVWREAGLVEPSPEVQLQLERSWRHMPAWPAAREAIAALRKRYVVAPLTILSCTMAVGSSRRNGIDWDLILSCDVLGVYKPDPRCYARAAEILDCVPDEIMMVAAHPSDLRAAIACGYRSAYVVSKIQDPGEDYTDTGFATEFDVVAQDFTELAKRLL